MANLPSQHPRLSLHLTDRALTPLITSSRTGPQLDALTSLSHTALSAHESAQRLGLGLPQRLIVEHADAGPVLLQSFLRAPAPSRPSTSTTTANGQAADNDGSRTRTGNGEVATPVEPEASPTSTLEQRLQQLQLLRGGSISSALDDAGAGATSPTLDAAEAEDANAPPMLVGIVVAPSADEARDARRAAARLERVGREVQARWAEAQQAQEDGDEEGGGARTGDAGD
ncbi:hypothetical protein F4677DRAFT_405122 [Hypoxylon crocopeplum]|nr:hypothetical protein F4677DRAFT_405122 [Hypoxylon crocopeplum]